VLVPRPVGARSAHIRAVSTAPETVDRFYRSPGEGDLEVSVPGGGHSYAGRGLTEGGPMIDLTPMKAVEVDASTAGQARRRDDASRARRATQAHGLAVPGGFS
jgi:hypothetical protein